MEGGPLKVHWALRLIAPRTFFLFEHRVRTRTHTIFVHILTTSVVLLVCSVETTSFESQNHASCFIQYMLFEAIGMISKQAVSFKRKPKSNAVRNYSTQTWDVLKVTKKYETTTFSINHLCAFVC